ncbi:MAG: hypothetical protein A3F16_04890 [Deltaproteobacteria bacterium RIFCSPHIGHO2_12_FULL_43_9]|nr:MAG: hypothetical protein A3F16_04890 [Deltaproteobacteria bacterium RIFCSPHIGHO2_12_FULL_43_9]
MKKNILYSIIFVALIIPADRVYSEDAESSLSAANNSEKQYDRKNMLIFATPPAYGGFGFEYLRYLNSGNSISSSIGIGFSSLDDHYSYTTETQSLSSGMRTITYFSYDNDITALSFPLSIGLHPVTIWRLTPFFKPGVAFLFPLQNFKYSDTDVVYTLVTAETGLEFTKDFFSMQVGVVAASDSKDVVKGIGANKDIDLGPVVKLGFLF